MSYRINKEASDGRIVNVITSYERDTGVVDKNLNNLVFLVGPPRSGSSWLQKMLGTHSAIGTVQESHLFNHFLAPALDAWDHLVEFDDGRGGIGLPAYMKQDKFDQLLGEFAISAFSQVPEYSEKVFLEKTPDHIRHLDHIQRLFPKAKIIILLRKPEDVIESMLNAGESWGKNWAPNSTIRAIRQYRYFVKKFDINITQQREPLIYVCRYEELKSNTREVIADILSFLNLECNEEIVRTLIEKPNSLNKYGEFATRSGTVVSEPIGFARQKKGQLNVVQKCLITMCLWSHKRAIGY